MVLYSWLFTLKPLIKLFSLRRCISHHWSLESLGTKEWSELIWGSRKRHSETQVWVKWGLITPIWSYCETGGWHLSRAVITTYTSFTAPDTAEPPLLRSTVNTVRLIQKVTAKLSRSTPLTFCASGRTCHWKSLISFRSCLWLHLNYLKFLSKTSFALNSLGPRFPL